MVTCFCLRYKKIAKGLPTSLNDLAHPRFKDKVLLIDKNFFCWSRSFNWTRELYGEDYLIWWENMKNSALTITDGWSSAYGMFTSGRLYRSLLYNITFYHVMYEDSTRYQVIIFDEGHSATIEGVGMLKSSEKI